MCGIVAQYGAFDPAELERMLDRLSHRGPDDAGTIEVGDAWLGHRRLSIVDLDGGRQPLSTPDGDVYLVGNGEVYNHAEVRDDLPADRLVTDSDNEVIRWALRLPARGQGHGSRPAREGASARGVRRVAPHHLLWRTKAEFGDGSGAREVLSEAVEATVTDAEFAAERDAVSPAQRTKEELRPPPDLARAPCVRERGAHAQPLRPGLTAPETPT